MHLQKVQAFPQLPRHFRKCLISAIPCDIYSGSAFLLRPLAVAGKVVVREDRQPRPHVIITQQVLRLMLFIHRSRQCKIQEWVTQNVQTVSSSCRRSACNHLWGCTPRLCSLGSWCVLVRAWGFADEGHHAIVGVFHQVKSKQYVNTGYPKWICQHL